MAQNAPPSGPGPQMGFILQKRCTFKTLIALYAQFFSIV